jgi:multiple sugar transport system ATP-binding protein
VTHDQVEAMTMGDRVAVLRRGVLQQFEVPQLLYEHPANLFVASFIGSPAMNILEATVELDGDAPVLRLGSTTLPVSRDNASALAGHTGKRIALGLRPEAFAELNGHNDGASGRMRGVVRAVEALGSEQLAHVEVEASPVLVEDVVEGLVDTDEVTDLVEIQQDGNGAQATVVARLDASSRVRPDEPIELAVDLRKLHFFDLDSGVAIG